MGCWNGTDGLTQLAIGAGDPCRLVIITGYKYASDEGGGYCYSTGMYEPFGLPIKGTYDDYGCIDDIEETLNTKHIVEWFEKQHAAGKLEFSDRAYVMDKYDGIVPKDGKFTIHQILNWMERGYVGVKEDDTSAAYRMHDLERHRKAKAGKNGDFDRLHPVTVAKLEIQEKIQQAVGPQPYIRHFTFMLIHEDIFQAVLKAGGNFETSFYVRDGGEDGKGGTVDSTFYEFKKREINKYIKSLEDMVKLRQKAKENPTDEKSAALMELRWALTDMRHELWGGSLINDILREGASEFIMRAMEAGQTAEVEQWAQDLVAYNTLLFFMECSRKGFAPQAGKGSQSDEFDLHVALAEAVLKVAGERRAERAKWDEEYKKLVAKTKKTATKKKKMVKKAATAKKVKKAK